MNAKLHSSVWVMFNHFLLTDETDRSKISSDHHRILFDVSLYPLFIFANTPFKYNQNTFLQKILQTNLNYFSAVFLCVLKKTLGPWYKLKVIEHFYQKKVLSILWSELSFLNFRYLNIQEQFYKSLLNHRLILLRSESKSCI